VNPAQRAQNLLAHVVTGSFQFSSHSLLEWLHWLNTEYHVNFKIANITFHTLHSPFLSTYLSTFGFACSSFHLFSWVIKCQSAYRLVYRHFIWHPQFQCRCSYSLEFLTSSATASRPTIFSRPSDPLSAFPLAPQIQLQQTIVRIYKLCFVTYLLTIVPSVL